MAPAPDLTIASRGRHALRVAAASALVAVLALAVAGCGDPPETRTDPGAASAEATVRSYIAVLNQNEPNAVAGITRRDLADAAERLREHGGQGLSDVRLSTVNEFPRIYHVSIQAVRANGAAASWTEVLEWNGSAWDFAPLSPPSSPGAPSG